MIPVQLYQNKVQDLRSVLAEMGRSPEQLAAWLFDDRHLSDVSLAKLKSQGDQSVALVSSMPKFVGATILGMKLTEPLRQQKAHQLLEQNQTALFEEINDIEQIQLSLRELQWVVSARIGAIREIEERLRDQASGGGENAGNAAVRADHIRGTVLPVLLRLGSELDRAVKMCKREIQARSDEVAYMDRKKLSVPKYNRRARRKRKARAAAKAAAEAAKKAEQDDKGEAG